MRGSITGQSGETMDRSISVHTAAETASERIQAAHQRVAARCSRGVWSWSGDQLVSKYSVRERSEVPHG